MRGSCDHADRQPEDGAGHGHAEHGTAQMGSLRERPAGDGLGNSRERVQEDGGKTVNIIETATDVVVLIWVMLITAYTMMLNKKVDAIRDEAGKKFGNNKEFLNLVTANVDAPYDRLGELETRCDRLESRLEVDLKDIQEELNDSDKRTVEAVKKHKEALRELYEHAQKACKIRSDMLQKITDLERYVRAHEMRHIEQEEAQWKD